MEDIHKPVVALESLQDKEGEEETAALLLTFNPIIEESLNASCEVYFLFDRSGINSISVSSNPAGSMSGSRMNQAVQALLQSLDCLNPSTYFDIVSFGSKYQTMFQQPQLASVENIEIASNSF